MNNPLFSLRHLALAYHHTPVITGLSVDIPQGKLCGIVGPNGSGKSTLCKALVGLMRPLAGTCTLADGCSVGYVPQRAAIDWNFPITVYDVVLMGTYGRLAWYQRVSQAEHLLVQKALQAVELEDRAHFLIRELSVGQQQRMFLARALAQDPQAYILDEPFAGVDARSEALMMSLLKELVAQGKSVLMIHHGLESVTTYFDWVLIIQRGEVVCGEVKDPAIVQSLAQLHRRE